ncbi:hypothetical protein [Pseudomonas auratipiscis]|uniref:Uncharacterized protein n=1 Tax=Pseudomonas auratipiscis TaxID=3115853 RepID=A0AB35WYM1_9PSED|nr:MULTISPECIES: hypothetical protein [unclassified Pseudomonas]MEE1868206.1 hypothetical protein [Pseudomonas sp. 120P]MEE1957155.1 hypothetical protein [Pseudomonas sp. 119P]
MAKNKGTPPKPRTEWVYGTTKDVVSELTISFDPATGLFSIPQLDPTSVYNKVTHPRDTKEDKVVSSFPIGGNEFYLDDMWPQLVKNFDHLMAIDTNYYGDPGFRERHNGYAIGVCSSYIIKKKLSELEMPFPVEPHKAFLIATKSDSSVFEPIGWHLAITSLNHNLLKGKRLGIIVDHDLGKIPAFNNREESYFKNHLLPEHIKLLYGSSDKTGSIINSIFKHCDSAGKSVMDHMKKHGFYVPKNSRQIHLDDFIIHDVHITHNQHS